MEFSAVNTIWVLVGAALVFFMQAGFAMVEAGFTRAKNAGNIIMKNLMDFCIGTPVFWLVGFGIGEVSSIYAIGIPGLNSLILAGLLYWVVMVVAARVKGVQNITFKETDEVL